MTPTERIEYLNECKVLYELKYPETKQGGAPGAGQGKGEASKDPNSGSFQKSVSFVDDTAKKTGLSKRTIRQAIHRTECLEQRKVLYLLKYPDTKQYVAGGVAKPATANLAVAEKTKAPATGALWSVLFEGVK